MKKRVIGIFIFILLAIFISLYFDSEIVKGVSLMRNSLFNNFFIGITNISSKLIIFFGLTSLFLWQAHKRKWILPLWVTLGLSVVVSFLLKFAVQRLRPYQLGIVSVPLSVMSYIQEVPHNQSGSYSLVLPGGTSYRKP